MLKGKAEEGIAPSNREVRRQGELNELTVDQVAARGDKVRVKCLDCNRSEEFPAAKLLPRHTGKFIGTLRPRCDDCFRRRRRGVGLHQPGYATYIEILWPDDRP
jgi:hypothetical protein